MGWHHQGYANQFGGDQSHVCQMQHQRVWMHLLGKRYHGGSRVSLVTNEPCVENRPILHHITKHFGFGTLDHPADFHVSLKNPEALLVVYLSDRIVQQRSKLSGRLINQAQVAPVSRITQVKAVESFEASENVSPQ